MTTPGCSAPLGAGDTDVEASTPRPARTMHSCGLPAGSAALPFYTDLEKSFKNKDEALAYLGANLRCTGHIARARKTSGCLSFFRCRLYQSEPPCDWVRMLRVEPDGGCTLWRNSASGCDHNSASLTVGVRGKASFEERQAVQAQFSERAYVAPKEVYRTSRLANRDIGLSEVQTIKKGLARTRFATNKMGELEEAVSKHRHIPADVHAGYFCVHFVGREPSGKAKLSLVATTRNLLDRFAACEDLPVQSDGGFKYNLLHWPLSVVCCSNRAQQCTTVALALSSSMVPAHIEELLQGFKDAVERPRCAISRPLLYHTVGWVDLC